MEQVWKNFSTKIRTDIRKATSSGLEVKSSSFDSFSLEQLLVFLAASLLVFVSLSKSLPLRFT